MFEGIFIAPPAGRGALVWGTRLFIPTFVQKFVSTSRVASKEIEVHQ